MMELRVGVGVVVREAQGDDVGEFEGTVARVERDWSTEGRDAVWITPVEPAMKRWYPLGYGPILSTQWDDHLTIVSPRTPLKTFRCSIAFRTAGKISQETGQLFWRDGVRFKATGPATYLWQVDVAAQSVDEAQSLVSKEVERILRTQDIVSFEVLTFQVVS